MIREQYIPPNLMKREIDTEWVRIGSSGRRWMLGLKLMTCKITAEEYFKEMDQIDEDVKVSYDRIFKETRARWEKY